MSRRLQLQCPGVLTQMYLNSMMNFWWYTDMFAQTLGANESLLLHDVKGDLVRVLQDGGNPNMTVWDWGQQRTRDVFMSAFSHASTPCLGPITHSQPHDVSALTPTHPSTHPPFQLLAHHLLLHSVCTA